MCTDILHKLLHLCREAAAAAVVLVSVRGCAAALRRGGTGARRAATRAAQSLKMFGAEKSARQSGKRHKGLFFRLHKRTERHLTAGLCAAAADLPTGTISRVRWVESISMSSGCGGCPTRLRDIQLPSTKVARQLFACAERRGAAGRSGAVVWSSSSVTAEVSQETGLVGPERADTGVSYLIGYVCSETPHHAFSAVSYLLYRLKNLSPSYLTLASTPNNDWYFCLNDYLTMQFSH